jgi:hypothetical protein
MPRRDLVRIVLVGDGKYQLDLLYPSTALTASDGVGKSSIITSLIKESFVTNVGVGNTRRHTKRFSNSPPGATRRAGSDHPPRSHPRERDDLDRGHFLYVTALRPIKPTS